MPAPETKKKLPILVTTKDLFVFLIENWRYAVRISWPWLALLVLVSLPATVATISTFGPDLTPDPERMAQQISRTQIASYIVGVFVAMAGWSSIAVLWHRRVLLGEDRSGWPISLGRHAGKYLLRFIFILLVVLVPSMLIAAVSDQKIQATAGGLIYMMMASGELNLILILASIVLSIILAIVSLRLSVSLPAAALGVKSIKPLVSWHATSGNSFRLLAIAILAGAPAFALNWLIFSLTVKTGWTQSSVGIVMLSVVSQAVNFIFVILGVTLLSLAYAFFLNVRPSETEEEQTLTLDSPEPGPAPSSS